MTGRRPPARPRHDAWEAARTAALDDLMVEAGIDHLLPWMRPVAALRADIATGEHRADEILRRALNLPGARADT